MKRLLALLLAVVALFGVAAQADAGTERSKPVTKVLAFRTQVAGQNSNGYLDSLVTRGDGTSRADTTAPFTLDDIDPEGLYARTAVGDTMLGFVFTFQPSSEATFTEAISNCDIQLQVSVGSNQWLSVTSLADPGEVGSTNTFLRAFFSNSNVLAAPTISSFLGWPAYRLIVTNDGNGEYQGRIAYWQKE